MRIQIESQGTTMNTTYERLLAALRSVVRDDFEFAAVLELMLQEQRIRVVT